MTRSHPAPTLHSRPWIRLGPLLLAALAASARAQSPPPSLSTVEVVGETLLEGVDQPLSQMPSNAQRISSDQIAPHSPSNLADLLNEQIGAVSVSNGTGNPYQNDINYRGFQATSLLGAPVSLSVYVDGVRLNEPFGALVNWDLIPMNALAGVNVLPGSNPMFGLNTLGGALVAQTKNGRDHSGSRVSLLGGSFGRRALQWERGWAHPGQSSDYFLAANWDRQDGYRAHSGSEVRQLYGKARWADARRGTRLETSLALADSRLSGTQSLPRDMMDSPASAYTWPDTVRNQAAYWSLKGRQALGGSNELSGQVYLRRSNSRSSHSNAELDDDCFDAAGSSAGSDCAGQAPAGTALNSVTHPAALALGYARWTGDIATSVVQGSIGQSTVGASLQWSNFDKLLGRDNVFALGAGWSRSRIAYTQASYLARLLAYQTVITPNQDYGFTANGQAPSAGNPASFTGSNQLRGVNLQARTQDLSLFFINTLSLTEQFKLSASASFNLSTISQRGSSQQYLNDDGGFSWTHSAGTAYYNPSYLGAYRASALSTPLAAPAGALAGPEVSSLDGEHRYRRINPALSFNHQLGAGRSLFGGYSEAMRAPTSVELSCANPQSPCALPTGFNGDPELQPVVARTVEFGGRGTWGQAAAWTAAVYVSRLANDIQFIAAPDSISYGYFANVGSTERRGLELGLKTRWEQLLLSLDFGHVRAVYKSEFSTEAGQEVRSGNRIAGIPANTLKLRAAYPFHPQWQLGAQLLAASGQYAHGNEGNRSPDGRVPGYGVLNLDLSHRLDSVWRLSLQVHNALDKKYSTYGLANIHSIYTLKSQGFQTPAAPRAIWLGLSYSLGGKPAG